MTPQERLRKHQRSLNKTMRELDTEHRKLVTRENQLVKEIRKSAKEGQMGAAKIQAKDLVRTRNYKEKFADMRSKIQQISLRIQVWPT
jgi:charged multivesicular body protein 2A